MVRRVCLFGCYPLNGVHRCGHCKKLAPIWTQLAKETRGKLNIAEVDCESNAAVCRSQGVTGYPMLFYYGKRGHGKTEYTSNRRLEQLKAFTEKISGPYVHSSARCCTRQIIRYKVPCSLYSTKGSTPRSQLMLHSFSCFIPSQTRTLR